MSKIELTDTVQDMMVKMADGNPGAITALVDLYTKSPTIDPDSAMADIGAILMFDNYGIYGSDIYIIWNDKCD